MKILALINTKTNHRQTDWQFNKVLSTIAFDCEVSIVFFGQGLDQCLHNIKWKSLALYGVENLFYVTSNSDEFMPVFSTTKISIKKMKQLIRQAQVII